MFVKIAVQARWMLVGLLAGILGGCTGGNGGGKQNQAPTAVDDSAITPRNTPVRIPVLANDTDPDGDALKVAEVQKPAHGTAVAQDDGTVLYTPTTGYQGVEKFNYTVSDGNGGSASAKVVVAVDVDCKDLDKDTYLGGPNCADGPDCDDSSAAIHPGATEICGDRVDNNCNHQMDETCVCINGALQACSNRTELSRFTSDMLCRPGYKRCIQGAWEATCAGEVLPGEEDCNGIDDNCDGRVDEDLRNPMGQCINENPTIPPESCGPTGEGNGLDDNNNNNVDEGCTCAVPGADPSLYRKAQPCYGGPVQTLGVGLCHGGQRDCLAAGTWGPCEGQVVPASEVCGDQQDNDCDGNVDESCPACSGSGDEVCDGVDNNCNGVIDEGVRNACGGCGQVATTEVCGDGLDNNCDGVIDEGCGCVAIVEPCYPGPAETVTHAPCQYGTRECSTEYVGDCTGYVLPGVELCGPDGKGNGIDEDCDGIVDGACKCPQGATRLCGNAAGACEYGTQTCDHGEWGACTGGVGPKPELCDDIDNNCNGLVDEGVRNACGKCGDSCYLQPVDPSAQGQRDESVVVLPANDPANPTGKQGITLSNNSFIPPYLWAANHTDNTASKFNTDTNTEEGIFWVGKNPSRTAVDLDGNVWVGGRDDGRLTKILWDRDACPDRNGNNRVDTSYNLNGVMVQVNSEADPLADECVVFSAVINPARPSIRGIAAAPNGKMYIGFSAGGVQSIDPHTFALGTFQPGDSVPQWAPDASGVGQPTGLNVTSGGVYGLVVDNRGNLYTSRLDARNTLARFDTNTDRWVAVYEGLCGEYGIAVDGKGRIWTGSYNHCRGVNMFDPAQNRFHAFVVPLTELPTPGSTSGVIHYSGNVYQQVVQQGANPGLAIFDTTGVGVEPATGDVWVSFYPIGYTGRLRLNEANLDQSTWTFIGTMRDENNQFLPNTTADLRGVGFDRHGWAWTLGLGSTNVFKIDPATNARAATLPLGAPVGRGSHYTYSDFTGSTALAFTAPRGFWRYVFTTPFDSAQVDSMKIMAQAPPNTSVGSRIRAMDANGVPGAWVPAENNGVPTFVEYPAGQVRQTVDLKTIGGPVTGKSFQVELRLTTTDRDVRPMVFDVQLGWQRP